MKLLIYSIIVTIVFIGCVRYLENTSVFYPSRRLAATPRELGLPFEDVYIRTQDNVKVHGWLIKAPSAKSTLLFFHGNAGNIGDRLEKIDVFQRRGLKVLIIDYRGYGNSEGRPTEKGIYNDAAAAYDFLLGRGDLDGRKIIGYGASLGGAVAVDLAAKRAVSCLILDSTFSSAADMARRIYPFVPPFLIGTKMDSIGKIKGIAVPKLFLHGTEDRTIPFDSGKKLYDAAPAPKEFIEMSGDHNDGDIRDGDKFREGIKNFLKKQDLI